MAVPKKRTGHSAQGKRRANWKATKPETTVCSNCGQPVLAHTVCTACGYYKGQPVSLKDKAAAEKEVKKPAKKAKAEAPAEEAPKAEETAVEEAEKAPKKTTRKKAAASADEKPKAKKTTKKAVEKEDAAE
ncbi:50S ribosomal protein L32 [bacterium]|nr:50S ribosomal protein L32 [bacterium]